MDLFDKAKDLAAEAVDKLGDVAGDAKDAVKHAGEAALHSGIAGTVGDKLGDAKDAIANAGSHVVDAVKDKLS